MRMVVVGLGSMGRRRVRLLKKISADYDIVGVDAREERRSQAEKEYKIKTYANLVNALDEFRPDCAIVSTSPLSHAEIICTCLNAGCHVFTELNLVTDGYDDNISLAKSKKKVLFISSTFLYRNEIRYIDKYLKGKNKVNYTYHVGQYLPDWHPWEKLNEYFVSDRRTNGCRELLAIELPWITRTFGKIVSYKCISDKNSGLPIQYKDNYLLLFVHDNGNKGVLAVDVISRKAVRNLEIYGEDVYLTWDGTAEGLIVYDYENRRPEAINLYSDVEHQKEYAEFIVENAYQAELEAFIDEVNGRGQAEYTMIDDYSTLKLIDKIEAD